MKSGVFLICIFCCFFAQAQLHYPLHPSVGDTIDRNEKLDYSLFPTVPNKDFEFATIGLEQDTFYLLITNFDSTIPRKVHLSREELIEAQKTIEKVNKYYRFKANQVTDTNSYQPQISERKAEPIRMESAMSEQIKKEVRMNIRLREDARRQREIEQGIRTNQLYINFD